MSLVFATRIATAGDAQAMADAHRDSIQSIGPRYYPAPAVDDWQYAIGPQLYVNAMAAGEVFFVATSASVPGVLGFASDYPISGSIHGMSVYVRGSVARHGIGTALLHLAEAHALANGGTTVDIEASLAGVEFYRRNGFIETGRGDTQLTSGRSLACVFMRKRLVRGAAPVAADDADTRAADDTHRAGRRWRR